MARHLLFPDVTFRPIDRDTLNQCLVGWGHKMGPVRRPTGGRSHALLVDGEPVAVAATDMLIRRRVAGLSRHEAVELSRLCAARPDLCRVALRLWRALVFPTLCQECGFVWALSYQDAAIHSGNLYRFDGWVRLATSRSGTDPRTGRKGRRKVIWGWCGRTMRAPVRPRQHLLVHHPSDEPRTLRPADICSSAESPLVEGLLW